jgi:CubicO group peptidase (beta-lactamase class C family)
MQENPDDAARRLLDLPNLLTEMEMADYFMKMPLARAPGQSWAYSNIAYDLVGVIIGKASGKFYGDYLKERIFVPLQMRDTRIIGPYDKGEGTATGYTRTAGRVHPELQSPALRNYLSMAAGGIESTVLDMAKYDVALSRGTLLSAASRDQIFAPSALIRAAAPGVTEAHYGFGWFITNPDNHRLLAHSGGMPGYIADFVRYPDDGISVILLTNQGFSGGPPQTASRTLARMFRPGLP